MSHGDSHSQARLLSERGRQHLQAGDRIGALDLSRAALAIHQDCIDAHLTLAALALEGADYIDLLSRIHKELAPATYLEIGIGAGTSIALAGQHTRTIGIDPAPMIRGELPATVQIYRETSDDFFARRTLKDAFGGKELDLAFIDGMHLFEYALRDFINIERNGTANTVVLYHDCYPLDAVTASRERVTGFWTGDVWKLTACLKKYRPDLSIHTLAARPTGLGVIRGLNPNSTVLRLQLDAICQEFVPLPYSALAADKRAVLNLVPGDWSTALRLVSPRAPSLPRSQALQIALQHHQAGRLPQAEEIYRQVLEEYPEDADALGLLGRIAYQAGKFELAIEMLGKAAYVQATNPFAANYLGEAYTAVGRFSDAEDYFRRAIAIKPDFYVALNNLGNILRNAGRPEEAEQVFRQALALAPELAELHNNFGATLADLGRTQEAERSYRRALEINPDFAEVHSNLGSWLRNLGRLEEAEYSFRQALARKPELAEAHSNLGATLGDLGRLTEAEQCYRRALALNPSLVLAHDNLGLALMRLGRLEEAEQSYLQALALQPEHAFGHNNLGNALRGLGRMEEAERSYRQALAAEPGYSQAYEHLIALLNYMPGRSAKEIYAEHREFARRYGQPVESTPHANAKDVNRRLRIGYISGDFRDHSVAFFIESVLERHNRKAFEVFCYYNFMHADSVTERLKARADHWRDVAALNDDDLVSLIRSDVIDILIDLSGHTAHNRLLALARKPAPVQVTWLGYLNTTGLDAMDYRITDAHASPEALFDDVHTEELIRLPGSQWCYRPHKDSPGIVPPPSIKSGFITFGAFTNLAKIGQPVIDLWSRLLEKMPESRLLIVGRGLGTVGDDFLSRFARNGLAVERISLREFGPFEEYLSLHDTVDIVLDTFPFTGGTTSCHALWMGVPIVTIVGDTPASRGGASILNTIGLGEFVAQTAQQYLDVAANLASNPGRLAELRATMRERMAASPLMDETRFTRHLEKAFRSMWRTWCKKNQ